MVAFIYLLKVIFFAACYDVAPRRSLLLSGKSQKQSDYVGCDTHVRGVGLTECVTRACVPFSLPWECPCGHPESVPPTLRCRPGLGEEQLGMA